MKRGKRKRKKKKKRRKPGFARAKTPKIRKERTKRRRKKKGEVVRWLGAVAISGDGRGGGDGGVDDGSCGKSDRGSKRRTSSAVIAPTAGEGLAGVKFVVVVVVESSSGTGDGLPRRRLQARARGGGAEKVK